VVLLGGGVWEQIEGVIREGYMTLSWNYNYWYITGNVIITGQGRDDRCQ